MSLPCWQGDGLVAPSTREWIEVVREVPQAFLGECGIYPGDDEFYRRALIRLVDGLLVGALDAFLVGRCSRVDVALGADGSVELRTDARGYVTEAPGEPWPGLSMFITVPDTYLRTRRTAHFQYGKSERIEVIVSAVSEWLTVSFPHESQQWELAFARGAPLFAQASPAAQPAETVIRFKPDATIFPDPQLDAGRLADHLRERSFLLPGLTVTLRDERTPDAPQTFFSVIGVADLAQHFTAEVPTALAAPIYLRGELSDSVGLRIRVEVALTWQDSLMRFVTGYTNGCLNPANGAHVSSLLRELPGCLTNYALESCLLGEGARGRFAVESACAGLTAVVSVWHCEPVYERSMQLMLCSADVRPVIQRLVRHDLEAWLWAHPDEARAIVRHVLERALLPWPLQGPCNAAAPVP